MNTNDGERKSFPFRLVTSGEKGELSQRKATLRTAMKKRRGENENRDAKEELLLQNFLSTGAGEKNTFFVYLSFSSEAPTDKLIAYLLASDKQVYCPKTENKEMKPIPFYGEDKTDISLSSYGIKEPIGEEYPGKIDVAIVPLLAADERGNRLGYGGGYYDGFLSRHQETLAIGYCFDFQILREIPVGKGDKPLDRIVTDKRVIDCRRANKDGKNNLETNL